MTEADENAALVALLKAGRGIYGSAERFHLRLDVVLAVVRTIMALRPDVTPDEVVRSAGKLGIPRSVLVRVGRGQPVPVMPPATNSWWPRRPKLASRWW